MTLLRRWRQWWRTFSEVRQISRGLSRREQRRLGKLALSGQPIEDPRDAEAVRAIVRFGAADPLPTWTLNFGLAIAILAGGLLVVSGVLRPDWATLLLSLATLLLIPLAL